MPIRIKSKFQSTPPRGRRQRHVGRNVRIGRFQSTPPRGRRPQDQVRTDGPLCFNPRLRAGGDMGWCISFQPNSRFNPRLRAGGDASCWP